MGERWPSAAVGLMVVSGGLWLASCASAPTAQSLATEAAAAMGGLERLRNVQTVVMRDGAGTRLRLGQMVRATDAETPAALSKVTETSISSTAARCSTTRSSSVSSPSTGRRS